MGKGKEHSPEEQEQRAKIRELLRASGVEDIQSLFEVRRLIYTANAIGGFNRQLRKVTKANPDDNLLKMLYLAMMGITRKWTGRRQDWNIIHAQLAVHFAQRIPD